MTKVDTIREKVDSRVLLLYRDILTDIKLIKTYQSFKNMHYRCNNLDDENYGGRGISVCDRWHCFSNFLEDMGPQPPGFTIDRMNNEGNYNSKNCRWASRKQQANNKRTNKNYERRQRNRKYMIDLTRSINKLIQAIDNLNDMNKIFKS